MWVEHCSLRQPASTDPRQQLTVQPLQPQRTHLRQRNVTNSGNDMAAKQRLIPPHGHRPHTSTDMNQPLVKKPDQRQRAGVPTIGCVVTSSISKDTSSFIPVENPAQRGRSPVTRSGEAGHPGGGGARPDILSVSSRLSFLRAAASRYIGASDGASFAKAREPSGH